MARESCNFNKDEAEILKPTSSPSPSPQSPSSSSPPPPPPPSPLFIKHSQEFPAPNSPANPSPAELNYEARPAESEPVVEPPAASEQQYVNRCNTCRKRVGLTGFRCRCGHLFCPRHRYSDTHDCSFDYKAAGRAEIAKANPVIRAAKIIKI